MKTKIISILALLLTVTQGAWAQVGRVLATDGKYYKTVTAATNAGTTASGVIAYVPGSGDMLVMSLTVAKNGGSNAMAWGSGTATGSWIHAYPTLSEALGAAGGVAATDCYIDYDNKNSSSGRWIAATAARNYSTARPSGASAWSLPSAGDWNNMLKALAGTSSNISTSSQAIFSTTSVSSKLTAAGASGLGYANFWSSTEGTAGNVWTLVLTTDGGSMYHGEKSQNSYTFLRPIFTFPKASASAAKYTVSYNANGGDGAPSAQTKDGGIDLTLSSTVPTRTGYTFLGWATSAEGAAAYAAGATYTGNADLSLYAKWTANTYSVHFNGNGSTSGSMDNESFTYDEAKTLTTNAFSRTGYTFDGWATTADGDVAYTDGQSVSNLTAENGATVELFAHWSSNTTTSGIDWNPSTNSGTFLMPAYNVEVSTELWYLVDEEKTPAENIEAYGTKSDFFLNRTLTANVWNTFASPFAIAAGDMEKYFGAGAKVRQLESTTVDGTVLTLNFTDATSIVAGKPYLVKPAANVDFSADGKEFAGVNLNDATATPTPTTYVNFIPTLGKTLVEGNVNDILILNGSGTLVHPSAEGNMKGFRGYFLMHEETASLARAFVINFGEGETTGIQPIRMENGTTPAEGTYDLSGRRIQGQPTQKGVYIQNGKKVIIK